MNENVQTAPLPRYKCHKEVRALRIAEVLSTTDDGRELENGALVLVPTDRRFGSVHVGAEYARKHEPKAGGYYVEYEGGYASFSPAEAFEAGYEATVEGTSLTAAEVRLAEVAEHLRGCGRCGESDVSACPDGRRLWVAAGLRI